MGYRIDYKPASRVRRREKDRFGSVLLSGLFFLFFLFMVKIVWPSGWDVLTGLIFSGDLAVTAAAVENLALQLDMGVPAEDAFLSFFRTIMEGSAVAAY